MIYFAVACGAGFQPADASANRLPGRQDACPTTSYSMPRHRRAAGMLFVAVLYWCGLFVATHAPIDIPLSAGRLDKLQHTAAFLGLGALLYAVAANYWRPGWVTGVGMFLVAGAYGAFDEWTQQFVPGRTADAMDWVADMIGAAIGIGLAAAIARRWSISTAPQRGATS